ncbi:MAG: pyruvate carboxylase subunit B [Chitinispirillaceae bacterium]|nr:pyruvate carboxylase subunit B [Chitinispirillaceae bacterium]
MAKEKMRTEDQLHKIPLRITDTTLRDAHQSLWATRMRTDDMLSIIDVVDNVGYYSLECWGGATFDVCLRFLRENPWDRLRQIKAKAKNTPLQMLLRGQNLVGYRNYADDVVDRFVALACKNGIDIFRMFDALNDTRNLEAAVRAVKKYGGHAQGTLCYTISPVHTVDKFVEYAKEQVAIGVDSLCIKDMAGILSPIGVERLVRALLREVDVPIQLHSHASSGMAVATYVEGVRAGAGAIDCAISSMAGFSSQPPVETLAVIFDETNYSANLDLEAVERVAKFFDELAPRRKQSSGVLPYIDPAILIHQIPGGMISNFRSQLETQNALDKLAPALEEVSRVREDLGYPPLVTPTSQIVGTQAVMNVLAGERYKIVPNEVKNYVRGLYGKPPVPVHRKIIKKILGDEKPVTGRPADSLSPMLPKATDGVDPKLIEQEEDILSYVMLPEPAVEYFKWRALPPEQRPSTPADLELKSDKKGVEKEQQSEAVSTRQPSSPFVSAIESLVSNAPALVQELLQKIDGLTLDEVVFRKDSERIAVRASGQDVSERIPVSSLQPAAPSPAGPTTEPVKEEKTQAAGAGGSIKEYLLTINAPLVGKFYSAPGAGKKPFVKEGDVVNAGVKVCIVEAMKLFNEILAQKRCKIIKFLVEDGVTVNKGQPLIAIEEA